MKLIRNIFLFLVLTSIFLLHPLFSSEYDSLLKVLNNSNTQQKAILLNKLATIIVDQDPNLALKYSESALEFAKNNSNSQEYAKALKNKALAYDYSNQFTLAMDFYKKAIPFAKTEGLNSVLHAIYNNLGIIYKNRGSFVKAIENYEKALTTAEKMSDTLKMATTLLNIGNIYNELAQFDKALESYFQSLSYSEKVYNYYGRRANLKNIATVYDKIGDLKKSLTFYDQAIKLATQSNDKETKASALIDKAALCIRRNDFNEAERLLNDGYALYQILGDTIGMSRASFQFGLLKKVQKKFNEAEKYLLSAYETAHRIKYSIVEKNICFELADIYKQKNDNNNGFLFLQRYSQLRDSLFNIEDTKNLELIQIRFESNRHDREIELLNKQASEKNILLAKEKTNMYIVVVFFMLLLIFVIVLLVLFHKRNLAYKNLVQMNLEFIKNEDELNRLRETIKQQENNLKVNEIHTEPLPVENVQQEVTLGEISSTFSMSPDQYKKLHESIIFQFEEKRVYLDPKLNIDSLAEILNTNRTYISKVINESFNKNFNNFINSFRVKEAIKILSDEDYKNYTLENIATLAGFNNKTTFNTTFKKYTGITPSFFRDNADSRELISFNED